VPKATADSAKSVQVDTTQRRQPDAVTPDGGTYFGALLNGKLHGKGIIEWKNGARYEGGFEHGLFSGKGKFTTAAYVYEGDYKDGMKMGHGRYAEPDGVIYVGQFANETFNGHGRYEQQGMVYEGMFVNGSFNGKGKWIGDGEEYAGEFKNGKYSGKGELKYKDGRHYSGMFVDGLFQGKGRYESADHQVYEGEFDKGDFTGNGSYRGSDGSLHVGDFRKWDPQGPGKFTDAKGNVYEGVFTNGDLSGKGQLTIKDGRRYEGEFKNWKYHGQGVFRYANGDEYRGGFAYGLFEGDGVLTYAKPQKDGRTKDAGTWRYGQLQDPEADNRTRQNVETALYNQRTLLDKAIATLSSREPGKINMYLLAIGGDGSQEVFRREVEFVRKQFDHEFGTQGRSLTLINSRSSVAEVPMATLTSIREGLKAVADRMDKENDILFLFLTSHGSKDHRLTLDQNGMELRNLDAKELGKLLKESGIRWKVVVVSACYSGGFVEPIKDERTMVITAARHDRTSFGCADENDFTYFGKAFFKESVPNTQSFGAAFHMAQSLVKKWENEDFKNSDGKQQGDATHSEPQIFHTPSIDKQLERWRKQLIHSQTERKTQSVKQSVSETAASATADNAIDAKR
jgi:hypothetical protein